MRSLRILLLILCPAAAFAGQSANYSLTPETLDAAGFTGNGASYHATFSMSPGEAGASAGYSLRSGFAGQLELTLIHLTASPSTVNENSIVQLAAALISDAGAVTPLDPGDLTWSVLSGPIAAVTSGGLAATESVWQDSPAAVRATWSGITGTLVLTVRDSIADNFPPYHADYMPDAWQVRQFGLTGTLAGPHDDHDRDGLDNVMELAFGTDAAGETNSPDELSYFGPLTGGGTLLRPGLPVLRSMPGPGGPEWAALFIRRSDSAGAGLHYAPQFSSDLNTWLDAAAPVALLASDGTLETLIATPPAALAGESRHYFRILVSIGP